MTKILNEVSCVIDKRVTSREAEPTTRRRDGSPMMYYNDVRGNMDPVECHCIAQSPDKMQM